MLHIFNDIDSMIEASIICINTRACACSHTRTTAHTHSHTRTRTHMCTHTSIHVHTHEHRHTFPRAKPRRHNITFTYACPRANTHKHTHASRAQWQTRPLKFNYLYRITLNKITHLLSISIILSNNRCIEVIYFPVKFFCWNKQGFNLRFIFVSM